MGQAKTYPRPPSVIAEFYEWWKAELLKLLGKRFPFRISSKKLRTPDIIITREAHLIGEGRVPFPVADASAVAQALKSRPRSQSRKLHLQLGPGRAVVRTLASKKIPLARAYQMAELDVSANTPFALEDIYILFISDDLPSGPTQYVILRRDILDPIVNMIGRAKHQIGIISLGGGTSDVLIVEYAASFFNPTNVLRRLGRHWFPWAACGLVAVTTYNVFSSVERAAADVTLKIEAAEPLAAKARKALKKRNDDIARLQALYHEKSNYVPAVTILRELTRIVPDGTFLTDFAIQKQKIRISGFSTSAASLISVVESSRLFAGPRFTAAVVKVPGRNGEQFNMDIELEHVD